MERGSSGRRRFFAGRAEAIDVHARLVELIGIEADASLNLDARRGEVAVADVINEALDLFFRGMVLVDCEKGPT